MKELVMANIDDERDGRQFGIGIGIEIGIKSDSNGIKLMSILLLIQ